MFSLPEDSEDDSPAWHSSSSPCSFELSPSPPTSPIITFKKQSSAASSPLTTTNNTHSSTDASNTITTTNKPSRKKPKINESLPLRLDNNNTHDGIMECTSKKSAGASSSTKFKTNVHYNVNLTQNKWSKLLSSNLDIQQTQQDMKKSFIRGGGRNNQEVSSKKKRNNTYHSKKNDDDDLISPLKYLEDIQFSQIPSSLMVHTNNCNENNENIELKEDISNVNTNSSHSHQGESNDDSFQLGDDLLLDDISNEEVAKIQTKSLTNSKSNFLSKFKITPEKKKSPNLNTTKSITNTSNTHNNITNASNSVSNSATTTTGTSSSEIPQPIEKKAKQVFKIKNNADRKSMERSKNKFENWLKHSNNNSGNTNNIANTSPVKEMLDHEYTNEFSTNIVDLKSMNVDLNEITTSSINNINGNTISNSRIVSDDKMDCKNENNLNSSNSNSNATIIDISNQSSDKKRKLNIITKGTLTIKKKKINNEHNNIASTNTNNTNTTSVCNNDNIDSIATNHTVMTIPQISNSSEPITCSIDDIIREANCIETMSDDLSMEMNEISNHSTEPLSSCNINDTTTTNTLNDNNSQKTTTQTHSTTTTSQSTTQSKSKKKSLTQSPKQSSSSNTINSTNTDTTKQSTRKKSSNLKYYNQFKDNADGLCFSMGEECKQCKCWNDKEMIESGMKNNNSDSSLYKCHECKFKFKPILSIQYQDVDLKNLSDLNNEINVMSKQSVLSEMKLLNKLTSKLIFEKNLNVFWNLLYHFGSINEGIKFYQNSKQTKKKKNTKIVKGQKSLFDFIK